MMFTLKRISRLLIALGFCGGGLWLANVTARQTQKPKLFLPTQAPPNARYAGSQACAQCHADYAKHQIDSAMGRALETCANCQLLRERPLLTWQNGKYQYKIERKGEQSLFTVTDGVETITEPILWCFGKGDAGQTYVFKHAGQFYESRASYFTKINGLDATLGSPKKPPVLLTEALGRQMQSADTKDCFSCHATAALSEGNLQLDKMTPGVTCEACHGPGTEHIAAAKAGKFAGKFVTADKSIFNPATLDAYDLSQQFCGACHRSWESVMTSGVRGIGNVRFQPYRLTYSACYDPEDKRISCTACHNPHEAPPHEVTAYDSKCAACHQVKGQTQAAKTGAGKRAAACRVGTTKCASCHMPRYEIPGSHFTFSDHFIRVVKAGEPYPN